MSTLRDRADALRAELESLPPQTYYRDVGTIPNPRMDDNLYSASKSGEIGVEAAEIALEAADDVFFSAQQAAASANSASASASASASTAAQQASIAKNEADRAEVIASTLEISGDIADLAGTIAALPKIKPTLNLDFINQKQLLPMVDFTRGSTATYTDAMGRIRPAEIGEPRFTYDPVTGEALGLLIEDQRTNLLLWSEDFTNEVWNLGRLTLSVGGAGVKRETTDRLFETTESGAHSLSTSAEFTEGKQYVRQVAIKPQGRTYFAIAIDGGPFGNNSQKAVFNTIDNSVFGELGGAKGHIEDLSGGFKLLTLTTVQAIESRNAGVRFYLRESANTESYEGDPSKGCDIDFMQLEEGTTPSSYIPTEGSQVTRAADRVTSVLGDEFNARDYSVFIDLELFELPKVGAQDSAFHIWKDASNRLGIFRNPQSSIFYVIVRVDGNNPITTPIGGASNAKKMCLTLTGDVLTFIADGALIGSTVLSEVPDLSGATMYLLKHPNILSWISNGVCKGVNLYPRALTVAEAEELTS